MQSNTIELRLPRLEESAEFERARAAIPADNPTFLHYYSPQVSFAEYLAVLRDQTRGLRLPTANHVATTFLFAFEGTRIVGRVSIRHTLNQQSFLMGGHIGYAVLPPFRNRGIATEILRLALAHMRATLPHTRALVTCDDDNVASAKVIERNGGVLENIYRDPVSDVEKRRYWIELV